MINSLNDKQKEAALCIDEHVRIIAGAGSGKTRVLMARIEYLLNDIGIYPSRILAITFTNKAAGEMKERLRQQVPDLADQVRISTIHSLCVRILREDAAAAGYPKNFTILDGDDQRSMLRKIYKKHGLNAKDYPQPAVLGMISRWKREGVSPKEAAEKAWKQNMMAEAQVYEDYQQELDRMLAMDFDDLLIECDLLLQKNEDVRNKWQRRLDYLHVDEFQDVDPIQYSIIRSLTRDDAILAVVGDPDQTIYTWRGAAIDIILNFEKDFQPCKTVILSENYRSTAPILNASNGLISYNRNRIKKDLYTKQGGDDVIEFTESYDDDSEGLDVAREMRALKREGASWRDMAVLYRSNFQSRPIEKALRLSSIPYRIIGGTRFYERAEIKDMLAYLHLLARPEEGDEKQLALDLYVERVANTPRRQIGPKFMEELSNGAIERDINLLEAMKDASWMKAASQKKANKFYELIASLKEGLQKDIASRNLPHIIDRILRESGYEKMLRAGGEEEQNRLENIEELKNDLSKAVEENPELTLESYLQDVALFTSSAVEESENSVTLMTVHAAKGTEYPDIFLVGVNEGIFPSSRAAKDLEGEEEERRLMYVAMTRAKKRLFISWNQGFSYSTGSHKSASRFINEIPQEYTSWKEDEEEETPVLKVPTYAERKKSARTLAERRAKTGKKKAKLHPGSIVEHAKFGQGVVISAAGSVIQVVFKEPYGTKKIAENFLQAVEE